MKTHSLFPFILLTIYAAQAQVIHVPGDYPTIQLGIGAALPGDTVLVDDGTYYEQVTFMGKKPLTLASRFMIDGDTDHIVNTIIDGSQLPDPYNSSVVSFISGEDTTSVLCGFTIRNGKGTLDSRLGYMLRSGGGIFISGSGAKIVSNHIRGNHLTDESPGDPQGVYGAGICVFGTIDDFVVIDRNIIDNNSCHSGQLQAAGAGVLVYNQHFRITNNIITGNECTASGNSTAIGAGIVCYCLEECQLDGIVRFNEIRNNLCGAENNFATAAAAFFELVPVLFSDNSVEENSVYTWEPGGGTGGLYILAPGEGTIIRNNLFRANASTLWAGSVCLERIDSGADVYPVLVENNYFMDNTAKKGGGFVDFGIPATLQNNVFTGNHADQYGGAVYVRKGITVNVVHLVTLINNSFYGNTADVHGGALFSDHGFPLVFNSIFFNDSAAGTSQEIWLYHVSDTVEVVYSDLDMGLVSGNILDGGYNIGEDPLFMDPVHLVPFNWSPVIDAGAPAYICEHGLYAESPPYQINGYSRPAGAGYDMGAYDHEAWSMAIDSIMNYELRITNYPNPVIASTTFTFYLKKPELVVLQVYNDSGQTVADIIAFQQSGRNTVVWNAGNLPAGIYYYRMQAGNRSAGGKLIKIE